MDLACLRAEWLEVMQSEGSFETITECMDDAKDTGLWPG